MSRRAASIAWAGAASALAALLAWGLSRYVGLAPVAAPSFVARGVTWTLREPRALVALFVLPALVATLGRSLADLAPAQRVLSTLARAALVVLLTLALARLSTTRVSERTSLVALVDVSDSMSDEALAEAKRSLDALFAAKGSEDVVRLVTFARRPRVVPLFEGAREVPALERHASTDRRDGSSATDVSAAMDLALGLSPPGYLRRIWLFSDGVETEGDALAAATRARDLGVRVHVVAPTSPPPFEVAVRDLALPAKIDVGAPFEVRADVSATRATRVEARLFQGETLNGLDGVRALDLVAGRNELVFHSVVRVPGSVTYRLELAPSEPDRFRENDRWSETVDVPGKPQVLYVDGEPARGAPLASALERQGFDVDLRSPLSSPTTLAELERFDFFVLSDVAAEQVSIETQTAIERWLRERGGGLLFAGGPNGYGPGGWQHAPLERVLPVRMDAERRKDVPSVALALVLDRSGSMTGMPLEMAKQAARATVDALSSDDLVEVVAFDSQPVRYVKMQPARNRSRIEGEIARIQAGGGTEIFPALDAAYQDMSVTEARRKHVILLTDGRAPTAGIRDLVQAMAADSITITTVGLGNEVDDQLLSTIKELGGGRYHKVPDPNSLPKIFVRETEMVAKSATTLDYFPMRVVEPASFLRGIDVAGAPMLAGYTATAMRPSPAQEILENPDHGDPLLARWHVGLGWSLAWTSDVKTRWAVGLSRWPAWPQFWGQLVHEHMRQKRQHELDMTVEVVGGEVRATVDAFTQDERFDDGLVSTLTLVGPAPETDARTMPMPQVAPGRYEARFALERFGSFTLHADHARVAADGRTAIVASSYGHVSVPYPPEYAAFAPDRAKLARIASAAAGAVAPEPRRAFAAYGEKISWDEDLWPRLVALALGALVVDVLVRRVRLFDRDFGAKRRVKA